ncbi:RNase P and RNase MRP subunit [Scheffersomyces xylosifermentans]|uniref:RNase P and RNase MRP subunit n=1 Tax=Scheffersomyces xylosifermentans TaxID=1304137 RepID=UPI00315D9975
MVRLKQRYILFDIIYPPTADSVEFSSFSTSHSNALLTLHQTSPASISPKTLIQAIRRTIQDNYGDFGAGTAGLSVSIKYFSNKTSTGIIRCGRSSFQTVISALTLMDKIESSNVLIRCIHVSGTIKKCEEYSIKRSRELMRLLSKDTSTIKDSLVSSLQTEAGDFENVERDEDIE